MSKVLFSNDDSIRSNILEAISSARKSLTLCLYHFSDPFYVAALVDAHNRFIKIKVLLDSQQAAAEGFITYRSIASRIGTKQARITNAPNGGNLHHKFLIVDDLLLLTGSFNWTARAELSHAENLMILSDKKLINSFIAEFTHCWNHSLTRPLPTTLRLLPFRVPPFANRRFDATASAAENRQDLLRKHPDLAHLFRPKDST